MQLKEKIATKSKQEGLAYNRLRQGPGEEPRRTRALVERENGLAVPPVGAGNGRGGLLSNF